MDEKKSAAVKSKEWRAEVLTEMADEMKEFPFIAMMSCLTPGHAQVFSTACFLEGEDGIATNVEIRNGDHYRTYAPSEIYVLGPQTAMGMPIPLESSFVITAENASSLLMLNIKIIVRKTGKVVFEKSVGQFGTISVKH